MLIIVESWERVVKQYSGCMRVIKMVRDLEDMMKKSFFTVWEPVKFLYALPVVLDEFWNGVCYYIRGHGALDSERKSL